MTSSSVREGFCWAIAQLPAGKQAAATRLAVQAILGAPIGQGARYHDIPEAL
jgi:hypothetical protein